MRNLKAYKPYKADRPDLRKAESLARLSDIWDVSEKTIERITRLDTFELKPFGPRPKTDIMYKNFSFGEDLQGLIWNYHSKNEHFTLADLLKGARENFDFDKGKTTLYNILKSMGYKYKHVNGRKILCEQKHVASKITFLRKFLQYQNSSENITFVYLDETWIFQNGSSVRKWVHDSEIKSNPSKIKSERKRFTVLHARSRFGFLEGCNLLQTSNSNDRDYHKTVNGEIFQNWVVNQLLPALNKIQGKCVVILDNAPYHSVQLEKLPSRNWKKDQMQDWLIKHNVKKKCESKTPSGSCSKTKRFPKEYTDGKQKTQGRTFQWHRGSKNYTQAQLSINAVVEGISGTMVLTYRAVVIF
ncbi:uncharacterized protein LOC116173115 [Photinus pyralis]|uniref:uncharacterized protein LOC116173115 n=1 Tax=Photinus pyralis TaxID=7054 RepID=UPI0012677EAE|nr:uncharacterized protein LOC116173115 [Photinus pyralis]